MSLDITLLRLMRHRPQFERLYSGLPRAGLEESTLTLLDDLAVYFREFPDAPEAEPEAFCLWREEFRHPSESDERKALYRTIVGKARDPVREELVSGLMERLVTSEAAYSILDAVRKYGDGEEIDLFSTVTSLMEDFETRLDRKAKAPWVKESVKDMLTDQSHDTGWHWRLDCLNQSMRPLQPGDFGIVAARPDAGKTTFLTSELAHMCSNEGATVVWLNNEGPGRRIKQRFYQSLLGATVPEMIAMLEAGTFDEAIQTETGGKDPDDLFKVVDIHGARSFDVDSILDRYPSDIVVFDMIDNIQFVGDAANNGQRTDQMLEAMYQWARNKAVKREMVALATSQVSAEGDGMSYPPLPVLKDSRTGKQGAVDFIITLGRLNDPAMDRSRFIGMTKNKLLRAGFPKDPRAEVVFEASRGRYANP